MTSLFDTRGGSLNRHRCEVCNEPLDEESLYPICEECQLDEESLYPICEECQPLTDSDD